MRIFVLIRSAAGSIFASEESHMMGVATDLARGKMYDIEETLLKDGFTDTDQSQSDWKPFEQEGWPLIYYKYDVIQVQFPNWDDLQAMAQGKAKAMGSGSGGSAAIGSAGSNALSLGSNDPLNSFQNSALGGMMGMMGMIGGGSKGTDIGGAQGASLIQSQYDMFQNILKVTVRKVKLYVKWQVLGRDRDMTVIAFFTDPSAMDKVLNGMGSVDVGAGATGSGSGTSPRTPTSTGSGSGK